MSYGEFVLCLLVFGGIPIGVALAILVGGDRALLWMLEQFERIWTRRGSA